MTGHVLRKAALAAAVLLVGCKKECDCSFASFGDSPRLSHATYDISEDECKQKDTEYSIMPGGHCEFKASWDSAQPLAPTN